MREYILVLLVGAAVTYVLTPLVRRGSVAVGALHAARSRDVHERPTPLLGGIAMYGGLAAGLLVCERLTFLQQSFPSSRTVPGLLLASGVLVVVGIIDDRWGMGAITKFAGQVAAGGILVWSGVQLPWLPLPSGQLVSFDPLESITLTILIVVVTINAVNFIDGLDGLAAGIVAVAALSFLAYSYTLAKTLAIPQQSLPALASALLAGMCLGFLPHNFNPARIFMGDTGSMLLGLLLAYGPISSTASLDPALLTNYAHTHTVNRFATILPILLPILVLIIPYADLMLAVIRRVRAGKSPFAPDKLHLQHRLLNIGHSHRQSVLIMYLWATLFSGIVVALSIVRTGLIWLAVATVAATLVLLPATMPSLRPWRAARGSRRARATLPGTFASPARASARTAASPERATASAGAAAAPATPPGTYATPAGNGPGFPPGLSALPSQPGPPHGPSAAPDDASRTLYDPSVPPHNGSVPGYHGTVPPHDPSVSSYGASPSYGASGPSSGASGVSPPYDPSVLRRRARFGASAAAAFPGGEAAFPDGGPPASPAGSFPRYRQESSAGPFPTAGSFPSSGPFASDGPFPAGDASPPPGPPAGLGHPPPGPGRPRTGSPPAA